MRKIITLGARDGALVLRGDGGLDVVPPGRMAGVRALLDGPDFDPEEITPADEEALGVAVAVQLLEFVLRCPELLRVARAAMAGDVELALMGDEVVARATPPAQELN